MRKVFVELKVRLVLNQDEIATTEEIVNELDYDFKDTTGMADVEDTEILDYEVIDSK